MSLSQIQTFLELIPSAISAKTQAVLALRNAREQKPDGSYVTKGDLLVQDILFGLLRTHLPNCRIVSEEQKNNAEPADTGTTVVIDPIDGTENFTSGLAEWGISVACYQDGRHAASLLACPEMGLWLRTGQTVQRHTSRIRALSSSLSKDDLIAATQGYEYRVLGCCVYNMLNVIRGSFQSFENPKGANSWDILAGLNLALEHKLSVSVENSVYHGEYLRPHKKYRFKIHG
jgi:myo-inositol-1(or 4)-monophosphatase